MNCKIKYVVAGGIILALAIIGIVAVSQDTAKADGLSGNPVRAIVYQYADVNPVPDSDNISVATRIVYVPRRGGVTYTFSGMREATLNIEVDPTIQASKFKNIVKSAVVDAGHAWGYILDESNVKFI